MADTKLTDLATDTSPGLDSIFYTVKDPSGTPLDKQNALSSIAQAVGYPCQGRLTTESGVPVSTSDRIAQGTLYFTPYNGNLIALYTSSAWKLYTFTEKSLSLTLTSGKNYDVFLYDNAGTLTIELSAAWTTDIARADAIAQQDAIDVKSSDHSRRLIGTIRASGTNVTEDSEAKRFVWSRYNWFARSLRNPTETTNSWGYTSGAWEQARATGTNQFEYVTGYAQSYIQAYVYATASASTASKNTSVGVGIDSTTVNSAYTRGGFTGSSAFPNPSARYHGNPGLGYHAIVWLEWGDTNVTFYGDAGSDAYQSGIMGTIWN